MARIQKRGSILDSVLAESSSLANTLGAGDKSKLNEYLDSVREVEQRIQTAEHQGTQSIELPDRPIGIPDSFEEHAKRYADNLPDATLITLDAG